ncbi:hypothetical protein ColTof4_03177 [Colletotrichum tofieldiae]|uniref:Uncharacterized protein n=1 Tax=Colletotrichum tofieldiae TaxID=708197 RepID=A0A166TZN1_9PEZI|nr:hypothetical protein CT0861_06539 [Colletotrichum tofieldiae]GKT66073.1 hypothetical protein ColTof3_13412 [Colletotrichum tofieldiae]GKT70754.1 hypothetical protein ColTof4_03177 [Colletotrichum tofieldiae]
MRSSILITALASATAVNAACAADNCYRNIKNQEVGSAFCATFTTDIVTETTGIPAEISTSCGVVRLSSACTCVYPPATSVCSKTVTSVSTETLPASTVILSGSAETVTLPPFTVTVSLPVVTATIVSRITVTASVGSSPEPTIETTSTTTIPTADPTFDSTL